MQHTYLQSSGHRESSFLALELVQKVGRRATDITGNSRKTTYLFQQLSVALKTWNYGGVISLRVHSRLYCCKPVI